MKYEDNDIVVINEVIKFRIDDTGREQLIELLKRIGSIVLDCPKCNLTLVPQANAAYASNGKDAQKITCVGCGKEMVVRTYPGYGFIDPDSVK